MPCSTEDLWKLVQEKAVADYFEEVAKDILPEKACKWILNNLEAVSTVSVVNFVTLLNLVEKESISASTAKQVLKLMISGDKTPGELIEEKGLWQINDKGTLQGFVKEVRALHEGVEEVEFLVGQVMKRSKGRANPRIVKKLLEGE